MKENEYLDFWIKENNTRDDKFIEFGELKLFVPKNVFSFDETLTHSTRFAFELGKPYENKDVLDMGCGSGVIGLSALSMGARHTTFIDNYSSAIEATRENVNRNNFSGQSSFNVSSLFENMEGKTFDTIIANLPIVKKAWPNLRKNTNDLHDEFLSQAKQFLKPQGRIIILSASFADPDALRTSIIDHDYTFSEVKEAKLGVIWHGFQLTLA